MGARTRFAGFAGIPFLLPVFILVVFSGAIPTSAKAATSEPTIAGQSATRAVHSQVPVATVRSVAPTIDHNASYLLIETATETATNQARGGQSLPALRHNDTLKRMAEAYARQMALAGFFSHTDPQGKIVSDRAEAAGYNYSTLGENLARLTIPDNRDVATCAVTGWMESPQHRANILTPEYNDIGIGVYRAADGRYYIVQLLGRQQ